MFAGLCKILKPWNQMLSPLFPASQETCVVLVVITGTDENPGLLRDSAIKKSKTHETVNCPSLVVCVVSDRCQQSLFPLRI